MANIPPVTVTAPRANTHPKHAVVVNITRAKSLDPPIGPTPPPTTGQLWPRGDKLVS